ncbi:MAG TPA: hypothetical protein VJ755_11075 [Gemmatimonadales bacterium]|nr:hypothetical protein [Gemmatimonadales bacterium]
MNDYLAQRLDGARDLYLLALAVGERGEGTGPDGFGSLIREARIHFVSVIEEARLAGLDIRDIQDMLATHTVDLMDTVRPDLRERLEELMRSRAHPR